MAKMSTIDWVAIVLLTIGGLNWGLAVFNVNLVTLLLGKFPILVKLVYGLVGLSAVYSLWFLIKQFN